MMKKEYGNSEETGFFIKESITDKKFKNVVEDFRKVLVSMGAVSVSLERADIIYSFRLSDKKNGLDLSGAGIKKESNEICFYADTLSALNHLVYTYIKESLGRAWVTPVGCVDISQGGKTFLVSDQQVQEYTLPFMISTQLWGDSEKWHRRMRRIGDKTINVQHIWRKFISPNEYFDSHPEYFAQVNGERKPYQLCTANPDVIKLYIDKAIEYFEKYPLIDAVSLSPSDNYNFCECDRCRSLDQVDNSITDRLMVFFNKVAEGVVEKYPDKKLAFYAYLNYTEPPVKVKPHKAVIPVICHTPWEFCHNHSITDENCVNNRFKKIVKAWVNLSDEVYIREYYGHFYWYGFWPILHTIKKDIDFYRSVGVKGIISESHEHWGAAGWVLYGAGCYLAGEDRSWEEIVAEYSKTIYPNSYEYVKELIFTLEQKTADVSCRRMDLVFDDKTMRKIEGLSKKISRGARTKNEKRYAGILKQGIFVTKTLIDINREIHNGNMDKMIFETERLLNWIESSEKNEEILPVIKYRLAGAVFSGKLRKFYRMKEDFRGFCEKEFNIKVNKIRKTDPIRKWLVSDPFKKSLTQSDKIKMYPDFMCDDFSGCLDDKHDIKLWHDAVYADDFFSLYQYFPFRPDCVKYYKKEFFLKKSLSGFFSVRAVDGYKLFLNGEEIYKSAKLRFDKKSLFDYIKIDIPVGKNEIVLKLESSSRLNLDDFSVILFNENCKSVKID